MTDLPYYCTRTIGTISLEPLLETNVDSINPYYGEKGGVQSMIKRSLKSKYRRTSGTTNDYTVLEKWKKKCMEFREIEGKEAWPYDGK